ncbi:MAG: hypothetical protein GY809_02825 [Planctomycetes bacterium]|nr:hypothetical protein [Planctomycetota bacterium]
MNKTMLINTASLVLSAGVVLIIVGTCKLVSNLPVSEEKAMSLYQQRLGYNAAQSAEMQKGMGTTMVSMSINAQRTPVRKEAIELLASGVLLALVGLLFGQLSSKNMSQAKIDCS